MTAFWESEGGLVAREIDHHKNPWDTVFLATWQLPGICEVQVESGRRVDEKKASGADGVVLTFHGRNPARVTIRLRIWTAEQLSVLDEALAEVWPAHGRTGATTDRLALDITHPACQMHGIKAISIVSMDGPAPGKVTGEKVVTLKCVEFIEVKKQESQPQTPKKAHADVTPNLRGEHPNAPPKANAPAPKPSQEDFAIPTSFKR